MLHNFKEIKKCLANQQIDLLKKSLIFSHIKIKKISKLMRIKELLNQ